MTAMPDFPGSHRLALMAGVTAAVGALRSVSRGALADSIAQGAGTVGLLDWAGYRTRLAESLGTALSSWWTQAAREAVLDATVTPIAPYIEQRAQLLADSAYAGSVTALSMTRGAADPWQRAGHVLRTAGLPDRSARAVTASWLTLVTDPADAPLAEVTADRVANRYLLARAAAIGDTEPHAAWWQSTVNTWRGNSEPGAWNMVWTGGECDQCAPYDGTEVGLDDGFDDGLPPLHPRCSCEVDLVPAGIVDQESAA